MSVADDPRLPAATPRPVPPPPPTGAGHPLRTLADAQCMRAVPVVRAARHTRYAPTQWRGFYLTTMRRVDFAAYSRRWGTTLAERFTSYMGIIRGTLVGIFAKPEDEGGMAVSIRCVNTVEKLAEYDAELAQDAQRQAEAEATQAHIARVCLGELDTILRHCDAARPDRAPHITCTNTADMVHRALAARPAHRPNIPCSLTSSDGWRRTRARSPTQPSLHASRRCQRYRTPRLRARPAASAASSPPPACSSTLSPGRWRRQPTAAFTAT